MRKIINKIMLNNIDYELLLCYDTFVDINDS